MKKMLFIYNPKAGRGRIREELADILDIFASAGYEITIYPTRKNGDAEKVAAERESDFNIVVCSGGDGTLDETVRGMMKNEYRTPLGYIPAGSTNDFGGSLALPKDMLKSADIIIHGKNKAVDVGLFNNEAFVYVAAFGAFTEVSYSTDQDMKNAIGHSAYLLEGMKSFTKIKPCHMIIEHDGETIEGNFIYGMVTNSNSVGGIKGITGENVNLADGLFEVNLIKEITTVIEFQKLFNALASGNYGLSENIVSFTSGHINFTSEKKVAWTLDGENGGKHDKVEILNVKQAIDIRVAK
ncbi:MAG: YegS/Rv2252/BmrU family lipid kinase [Lachnospiraceae bacterium]|nr:YegS/Rv2252/BmrU family lipid kinase [Lachnospiraceae bacterium]